MTWTAALVTAAVLCGAGALTALLHPLVLLCMAKTDAARRAEARQYARCSAFIIVCVIAWAANLSFAGHALNLAANIGMMACAGLLVLFTFDMRPKLAGISLGLLAAGAWLFGLLLCLASALFDGNSPATVRLDDGLVCRETVYGFVTSDSGEIMDIYRRYLFIDHRIYQQVHSDVTPNPPVQAPAGLRDATARCQAAVNAQRRAAVQGG